MTTAWQWQIRLQLGDDFALEVRREPSSDLLQSLNRVLAMHDASLICQFDAFAGYVAEAEANGVQRYPLYEWTKATLDDPTKKAKHLRSYTVYVKGEAVYSKQVADALDADLSPLVDGVRIEKIAKYDTNPANNPQPPKQ
jgi:hypothetical protein